MVLVGVLLLLLPRLEKVPRVKASGLLQFGSVFGKLSGKAIKRSRTPLPRPLDFGAPTPAARLNDVSRATDALIYSSARRVTTCGAGGVCDGVSFDDETSILICAMPCLNGPLLRMRVPIASLVRERRIEIPLPATPKSVSS